MVTAAGRPTPLREIARVVALALGAISAVVTFLLTSGAITLAQADAVNAGLGSADVLMSALVALTTAGTGVLAAFITARTGEDHVTPWNDPMNNNKERLVPETPSALGGIT